jgi:hypothetical protein
MFTSKLNLKVRRICIKPLLKLKNTNSKPCFEMAENIKTCFMKKKIRIILFWAPSSFQKNPSKLSKVAQLRKIAKSGHLGRISQIVRIYLIVINIGFFIDLSQL